MWHPRRVSRVLLIAGAIQLVGHGAVVSAQPPAPGGDTAPALTGPAERAPVIRFDPGGIGLDEAVGLALQHSPSMKLRRETVRLQEGIEQEQRGLFDLTLLANVLYDYRVQELSDNRKQAEIGKRDNLREFITSSEQVVGDARQVLDQLALVNRLPPGSEQVAVLTRLDARLGGQLQTIDALIAGAPPAARAELLQTRNEFIASSLASVRQIVDEREGELVEARRALDLLGAPPEDEVFYSARVGFQLSKLFRTGISFAPFIDGGVEGTNYRGKPVAAERGGKGFEDLYTFRAGAGVTVPLGRGRGRAAVGAFERSAAIEADAAERLLEHEASRAALGVVYAYWELRAAQEAVVVTRASADLQGTLVELTGNLIEAGELPQAERARSAASEARARARLVAAERRVIEARVALADAMGVAASEDPATLPFARDAFPAVSPGAMPAPELARLAEQAGANRQDVAAAVQREEAGRVLERGATTNLRPRVDLSLQAYYTALDEHSIANAMDRWVGPSTNVELQFERPFGNNFARGQLLQAQADLELRRVATADTLRLARLNVVRAARSLPEAMERVRQAEAAAKSYDATYDSELERFQVGESTLLNTVITEQQRTDARLALIAAQQEVASLIAELQFETATLLTNGRLAPQTSGLLPAGR
jgi:outer membrane protein TolC